VVNFRTVRNSVVRPISTRGALGASADYHRRNAPKASFVRFREAQTGLALMSGSPRRTIIDGSRNSCPPDSVVAVTIRGGKTMSKLFAVAILMISTSAFAQDKAADPAALRSCPPIGQTAKGELIYSLDCKAITTDYTIGEYKPNMPATNMKDTVIPKSGGVQTPETTSTKGVETK
jgi:hypothetical protein